MGQLHAAAAAAGRRLEQYWVADLARGLDGLPGAGQGTSRAGDGRDAEFLGRRLGPHLVAHHPDMLWLRPDKRETVLKHDIGEISVLGEKADTGMDRVRAGDRRRRQDGRDVEVAGARRWRADADALVGEPHVDR